MKRLFKRNIGLRKIIDNINSERLEKALIYKIT